MVHNPAKLSNCHQRRPIGVPMEAAEKHSSDYMTAMQLARLAAAPHYTQAEFLASLANWECFPVRVDGEIVGAVLRNGPELHACIEQRGRGRWAGKWVYRLIQDTKKLWGFVATRADGVGVEFVRRLGFVHSRGNIYVMR